jgi:NitT/TauT family transport system ATP-binding protein
MVTHNLREALMLADRIVVLSARPGQVVGVYEIALARQHRDPLAIGTLARSFQERFTQAL